MTVKTASPVLTGRILKAARVYAGLSQSEFAEKALTTQAGVSRLEAYDLQPVEAEPRLLKSVHDALKEAGVPINSDGSVTLMPSRIVGYPPRKR